VGDRDDMGVDTLQVALHVEIKETGLQDFDAAVA
jgi:hypothetical protein